MNQNPTLQTENERKYVLKNIPKGVKWHDVIFIEQFYIPMPDGKMRRVRYNYDLDLSHSFGTLRKIECIYKESVGTGQNIEHHYDVEKDQADEMIGNAVKKIQKTRYVHEFGGLKYEVDSFVGMNLTMMEIEVDNIEQDIFMPEPISCEIISDVTELAGNPFSNFKLAYELGKSRKTQHIL